LPHTFITELRHAPARVGQKLARHKSSAMTDRYTHVRMHDERAALEGLPDLTAPAAEAVRAKKPERTTGHRMRSRKTKHRQVTSEIVGRAIGRFGAQGPGSGRKSKPR
jgi:hypothetical protein